MKNNSNASELEKLSKLKDRGVLTDEEFQTEKSKLLNKGNSKKSANESTQVVQKENMGCMGIVGWTIGIIFFLYLLGSAMPIALGLILGYILFKVFASNKNAQTLSIVAVVVIALVWNSYYQNNKPIEESTSTTNTSQNTDTKEEPKVDPEKELFDNPEKLNTSVNVDGIIWKVTSAKNLGNNLKPKYSFNENCKTSGKYIKVTFNVKNTRKEMESLGDMYLYDSSKNQYTASSDADDCVDNTIYILDNINPGIQKSYTAVYEAPKEAKGFRLKVTDLKFLGDAHKYVSLGF